MSHVLLTPLTPYIYFLLYVNTHTCIVAPQCCFPPLRCKSIFTFRSTLLLTRSSIHLFIFQVLLLIT
jgi:hypothetical protein